MIGGTVLVRGSSGSRVGYGLKGGTVERVLPTFCLRSGGEVCTEFVPSF
jgi:hypothetical protein